MADQIYIAFMCWALGFFCATARFAPDTPFWNGFRDGLALMPLWRLLGFRSGRR